MNKNIAQIEALLHDFSGISDATITKNKLLVEINEHENPLNPNLLSYCFEVILGFDVRYRIFEKVHYEIEFDYKGTYGIVGHYKMSYRLNVERQFKAEIIELFSIIKPLLSQAFLEIGEEALTDNRFTMENESQYYFNKLYFYQDRIEKLESRITIIADKCKGLWVKIESEHGFTHSEPKCQDYINELSNEIIYSIETYIDVFFSCIEHILTLLYPFLKTFDHTKPYKNYIHNPKWSWDKKIEKVCGGNLDNYIEPFRFIKEIYRNRSTHGMFTRELMVYIDIPKFGRYPMYIGKRYLSGFLEDNDKSLTFSKYLDIKDKFDSFFKSLNALYEIPMLFVKSGLPIPVDTGLFTKEVFTPEQAKQAISRLWFELDNQINMDW